MRNIWIVRRERELHLHFAIVDVDRLTKPNETMSRLKPGYFTDFNAFVTCSSEIDIHEPYVRGGKRKRAPQN